MPYGSLPRGCSSSAASMIGVTVIAALRGSVSMPTMLSLRLMSGVCALHGLAVSFLPPGSG